VALPPGVKRPRHETDYSSPLRMRGAIHPLPQYAFMAWWSVKKKRSTGTNLSSTFILYEDDNYYSSLYCPCYEKVQKFIPMNILNKFKCRDITFWDRSV
jgi:hypothetical protein